jgi:hypothetical protein
MPVCSFFCFTCLHFPFLPFCTLLPFCLSAVSSAQLSALSYFQPLCRLSCFVSHHSPTSVSSVCIFLFCLSALSYLSAFQQFLLLQLSALSYFLRSLPIILLHQSSLSYFFFTCLQVPTCLHFCNWLQLHQSVTALWLLLSLLLFSLSATVYYILLMFYRIAETSTEAIKHVIEVYLPYQFYNTAFRHVKPIALKCRLLLQCKVRRWHSHC